jgi:hypothetical protein
MWNAEGDGRGQTKGSAANSAAQGRNARQKSRLTFVRVDHLDGIVQILRLDNGEDGAEDLLPCGEKLRKRVSAELPTLSFPRPESSLVAVHAGVGEENRRSDKVALGETIHLDMSAVESDLAALGFARGDEGLDTLLGGRSDKRSTINVEQCAELEEIGGRERGEARRRRRAKAEGGIRKQGESARLLQQESTG